MFKSIFRGDQWLGAFSLSEAVTMLRAGELRTDDRLEEGTSPDTVGEWVETTRLPRPPAPVPVNRQAIPLPPAESPRRRSPNRNITRRDLLIGGGSCLTGAAATYIISRFGTGRVQTLHSIADARSRIRRSMVRILILESPASSGTGFCMGIGGSPGRCVIATASHVVNGRRIHQLEANAEAARVESIADGDSVITAPWCYEGWSDVCAFHSRLPLEPLPLAKELPSVGERIFAAGFPGGGKLEVVEGKVTGFSIEPACRLVTSLGIAPGYSGGPFLNERGEVVGMCVTRRVDGVVSSSAAPLHEVHNLLERIHFIARSAD